jgi:hypothetical protein
MSIVAKIIRKSKNTELCIKIIYFFVSKQIYNIFAQVLVYSFELTPFYKKWNHIFNFLPKLIFGILLSDNL